MSHVSARGYAIIEALAEKAPLLQGPATILAQPLRKRVRGKGRRSSIRNGRHGNCCPYGRRTVQVNPYVSFCGAATPVGAPITDRQVRARLFDQAATRMAAFRQD